MASDKKFHGLLQALLDSMPAHLNATSKSENFKYALENKASGIWTTTKLNNLLQFCPADQIKFVESISRKDKIQAICGWIQSIFQNNDQFLDQAVAEKLEFSAVEVSKLVSEAIAKEKKKIESLEAQLANQTSSKRKADNLESEKFKQLQVQKDGLSMQMAQLDKEMKSLSKKDQLLISSEDESFSEEDDEQKMASKRNSYSGVSVVGGVDVSFNRKLGQDSTRVLKVFDKQTLTRLVVTNFDPSMPMQEMAQCIAAISQLMYKNFGIITLIEKRESFEFLKLLPFSAESEVSLVASQRAARYLQGQSRNWKAATMDSWDKFLQAINIWITILTEVDPAMITQVMALQNQAILFRELYRSDEEFVSIFLPYVNAMTRNRFREAKKANQLPNFEILDQNFMPARYFNHFGALKRSIEGRFEAVTKPSVAPTRKSLASSTKQRTVVLYSDSSEDVDEFEDIAGDEEEIVAPLPGKLKSKKVGGKPVPCFAFQLAASSAACQASTCSFCNNGGDYCMICNDKSHGAANCLQSAYKERQLEFFKSVLKPGASKKNGWHPIYGGAPFKLFKYSSLDAWQAAIKNDQVSELEFMQAARQCRKEASKLQKGEKATQAFVYPAARK